MTLIRTQTIERVKNNPNVGISGGDRRVFVYDDNGDEYGGLSFPNYSFGLVHSDCEFNDQSHDSYYDVFHEHKWFFEKSVEEIYET